MSDEARLERIEKKLDEVGQAIEANLAAQIEKQKNPPTETGLPWN